MIDSSIRNYAIAAFFILRALDLTNAAAQEADVPYGFAWSQTRESLPDPSSVIVDANITRLTYQGQKLPPNVSDADALVLRLCDGHGLQQVRWLGHTYPLADAAGRFLDFYEQITQRTGEADQYDPEHAIAAWSHEHSRMHLEGDEDRNYRVVVIHDGPQYADCRAEHAKITGRK
jgi:hypothetical protein